jgi:nitrogen fixation protein NifX
VKVAIATQDIAHVDAHLGRARNLMIYEVSQEGYHHLGITSFDDGRPDGDRARLGPRLEAMKGCALVFVADVGPEGEFGLARMNVIPIRQFAGQPIATVLDALWGRLRGDAPPWLRQIEQRCRRNGDLDAVDDPHQTEP